MTEEPRYDDSITGDNRWRLLQRLSLPLLIVAMVIGGLVIWDHHDYPVKGFGHAADPFGSSYWNEPFDEVGQILFRFRGELYARKAKRVYNRNLRNLNLQGTSWIFSTFGTAPKEGRISFKEDGSLSITPPPGADHEPWFDSTKFVFSRKSSPLTGAEPSPWLSGTISPRDQPGNVKMTSTATSYLATIKFHDNGKLILTIRSNTGPSLFENTLIFLTPITDSTSRKP